MAGVLLIDTSTSDRWTLDVTLSAVEPQPSERRALRAWRALGSAASREKQQTAVKSRDVV